MDRERESRVKKGCTVCVREEEPACCWSATEPGSVLSASRDFDFEGELKSSVMRGGV